MTPVAVDCGDDGEATGAANPPGAPIFLCSLVGSVIRYDEDPRHLLMKENAGGKESAPSQRQMYCVASLNASNGFRPLLCNRRRITPMI